MTRAASREERENMKMANLQRAARLGRALEDWGDFDEAFKVNRCGLSLDVGEIEQECGGEIVQPDHGIVVDDETGRLIISAAKRIIEAEIKKLGVVGSPTKDG